MKSKGSKCRLCRREGEKLFLKGERCISSKCSVSKRQTYDKKPTVPGQHIVRPSKLSDYGIQLREKQKVKRIYGIRERQFEKYFLEAERKKGITGEELLKILERRLDNVVLKSGFATSHNSARQMISHGHILVNGKKVNIPSYLVKIGEEISLSPESSFFKQLSAGERKIEVQNIPPWMTYDETTNVIKIISYPQREDMDSRIQEQLIVEYYSR